MLPLIAQALEQVLAQLFISLTLRYYKSDSTSFLWNKTSDSRDGAKKSARENTAKEREWGGGGERERDSLCQALPPPCLSPARACFSHFFLLNEFSPLSWSLEQAKREREREAGEEPTSLPLPFFHFFPLCSSILRHCPLSEHVEQAARDETPRSRKKEFCFAARQTQRTDEITFSTIKNFKAHC